MGTTRLLPQLLDLHKCLETSSFKLLNIADTLLSEKALHKTARESGT